MRSILDLFFGTPDPTREWKPYQGQRLTFDLDKSSLNGVEIGQPLDSISFLGRSEDRRSATQGEVRYYTQGLCVEAPHIEKRITAFHIVCSDPDQSRFRPFAGTVLAQARVINLHLLSLNGFLGQFGECFWLDRDTAESIAFYEFASSEWQVEFDGALMFKRLIVTAEPLLAQHAQREAYGVTKHWPPNIH